MKRNANAQARAAAPQLLKACQLALETIEKCTPIAGYPYGVGAIENTRQVLTVAIEKATDQKSDKN
jgi:hypothetical protein